MEVIVLTSPGHNSEEHTRIVDLFENGLETLHVRKPKYSSKEVEEFILSIPKKYRGCLIIHGHYDLAIKHKLKGVHLHRRHRSNTWRNRWKRFKMKRKHPSLLITATFNSVQSLSENESKLDYVFLAQVFSSSSMFDSSEETGINLLRRVVEQAKARVFALGGITEDKLDRVRSAGFHGIGMSSAVLKADSSVYLDSYRHFAAA